MLKNIKKKKITIYSQRRNISDIQALSWFKVRGFDIRKEKMHKLSKENLLQILSLTDQGFSEILKQKAGEGTELKNKLEKVHSLSFNDSIAYIVKNTDILKSPIIFGEGKLLVGFNAEEIRKFIPQKYRKVAVKVVRHSKIMKEEKNDKSISGKDFQ